MQIYLVLCGLLIVVNLPCGLGVCDDFLPGFCAKLAPFKPNLCSEPCFSQLCPRYCGRCALKCYQCHEVDNPASCTTTVECPSLDHYCVTTQSFTDDFREVYKMGCAVSSTCNQIIDPNASKRDTNLQGACCQSDNCNNKLPEMIHAENSLANPTTLRPTTSSMIHNSGVCSDLDQTICVDLAFQMRDMCVNDCIASNICPRMCGKCVECYDCAHVLRPENCNHTSVCRPGQSCYSLVTLSSTFEQGYTLGCLDESTCGRFTSPASAVGKRQLALSGGCCKTDFCNKHGVSAAATTTTQMPTTKTTTLRPTTDPSCSSHSIAAHRCPSGYTYTHKACYKIGSQPMNWNDANNYCAGTCSGTLAEFQTDVEMHAVLVDLHPVHSASDVHAHAEVYYIGAVFNNNRWEWQSSSSPVNSHIISVHDSRHTCAYGQFDYNHFTLSDISHAHSTSCTTLLQPLCQIK